LPTLSPQQQQPNKIKQNEAILQTPENRWNTITNNNNNKRLFNHHFAKP
jgi:hypothetical protein